MSKPHPDLNKLILLIHELACQGIIDKKTARKIYQSANGNMKGNLAEETRYIWETLYNDLELE